MMGGPTSSHEKNNWNSLEGKIPAGKVMRRQEDVNNVVVGSNPGAGKGFFFVQYLVPQYPVLHFCNGF